MGFPLSDITIYHPGSNIKDAPDGADFNEVCNYIADFYHNGLDGYKPAHTGRICIDLVLTKHLNKPNYFGAICNYQSIIDEQKYLSLIKEEKYQYILDLLHSSVSEIAKLYNWDQQVFDKSYNRIIERGFKFEKNYPQKRSPNRKHIGQIILTKTQEKSILHVAVTTGGITEKRVLLEKKNWYWYDSAYKLAKNSKWLDNSSFGFCKGERNCYYSTNNNGVITDLVFNNL